VCVCECVCVRARARARDSCASQAKIAYQVQSPLTDANPLLPRPV